MTTRGHNVTVSPSYKWIALSNTTLGILMASINMTILIISLPAIFRGIKIDPLHGHLGLLLWILMGFNVATTILLVSFGRISDTFGRVRLYNLGFAIFTLGSVLLFFTPGTGTTGEWELIIFRLVQGIGGAFLFANSAAILTDAFPPGERGLALGLNQIAGIAGGVIGLVVGGYLSTIDWRAIFLVNVPVGVAGTIWAYVALREISTRHESRHIDWIGNVTFALGLLGVMVGLTYSIRPYQHHAMGWQSPIVLTGLVGGFILLTAFVILENYVKDPMFHLGLFKIRAFSIGNITMLMAAVARGGLQFMLIIWLQGIWLPMHGVSFAKTPLEAGIDTIPQMVGFLVAGPISGRLSDRYGARWFSVAGMVLNALGYMLMNTLPANFHYWPFAAYLFILGAGQGLFASPNSSSIMNAVPSRYRGSASGMRATFMNAGQMLSIGVFFSIIISQLAAHLPLAITNGLHRFALPAGQVTQLSHLPPMQVLFAALLGYNPLKMLLPFAVLHALPPHQAAVLTSPRFFPGLIAGAFMKSLRVVFLFSAVLTLLAAILSIFRGGRFVYDDEAEEESDPAKPTVKPLPVSATLLALTAVSMAHERHQETEGPEAERQLRNALAFLAFIMGDISAAEALIPSGPLANHDNTRNSDLVGTTR